MTPSWRPDSISASKSAGKLAEKRLVGVPRRHGPAIVGVVCEDGAGLPTQRSAD